MAGMAPEDPDTLPPTSIVRDEGGYLPGGGLSVPPPFSNPDTAESVPYHRELAATEAGQVKNKNKPQP